MSISWPAFLFVVLAVSATLPAQQACPPATLQAAAEANLVPSASSYQVLLRQDDGSYSAYEITNGAPYQVLSTLPNFQRQLRTCPMVTPALAPYEIGVNAPRGPDGVFARLPSGGYLFVDTYSAFASPIENIQATVFDRNLNQVSRNEYVIPVQPGFQEGLAPLLVVDLNHDGNPDLVFERCLHQDSPFVGCGLEVMLGTGGGGFGPPVSYAISNDFGTTAIAAADINGDGNLDLVVATTPDPDLATTGKISVLLGKGEGSFQPEQIALSGPYVAGMAVADLNHDGKLDLAFSTVSELVGVGIANGVSVVLGAGDGTFSNPASYPVAFNSQRNPIAVAIGDLDGDGNADIVVTGGDYTVQTDCSILFGDGKGAFPTRRNYLLPSQSSIILTDFDGDGKTDIVIAEGDPQILYGSTVTVLFGKGDGEFAAPPLSFISSGYTMASADFDGDGILDLVVSQSNGISFILRGIGDGTFTATKQYDTVNGFVGALVIGDFNHDGKMDFAAVVRGLNGSALPLVQVFLGNGDSTFQTPLSTPVAALANTVAVGDFNGDGIPDLAVVAGSYLNASGDSLQILLGNGDGTFRKSTEYAAGPGAIDVVTADFNGDGNLDLAIANTGMQAPSSFQFTGGNVTILLGKGDGTFSTVATLPLMPAYGRSLATGDFNRDGKIDLAVAQADNIAVLPAHGDGTFGPAVVYPVSPTSPGIMAVDFNGDNILDLFVLPGALGRSMGMSGFLLGNGDGSFQQEVLVDFGFAFVAGDFNHDGKLDFATLAGSGVATLLNVSGTQSPLVVVSSASLQNGAVAPESLATAFGTNFASATAATGALPLVLAGSSVTIQDSTGVVRSAPLLYVSPQQVNFLVPSGTSTGTAIITVWNGAVPQSARPPIATVAPALFMLNADGLAAAYLVRVSADGRQTIEPVFTLRNSKRVALPVDLRPSTEQVYLILYGTGIRGAGKAGTSVTIKGLDAQVTYAGPQPDFAGLDQVNVLLPRDLAGSGDVTLVLTAAGATANPVHFIIK
jgi:uncharacterized protein (TIGR03437 family)